MKTPEQIAKETAESLVDVVPTAFGWRVIYVGPSIWSEAIQDVNKAEARAARCVEHLADGILRALKTQAAQQPTPSPVSGERLAEIWREVDSLTALGPQAVIRYADLRQHLAWLDLVLNGPEAAACRDAYERGFAAGREGR